MGERHLIKSKAVRLLVILILFSMKSQAQLAPFESMFYQNRYLLNPALAGTERGVVVNMNYRQQWNAFPGTPKTGLFSAAYAAGDKVGLGLNVSSDESGLIRKTRAMGSYAYHVQLEGDNQHLDFGLSLGVNNSRIDYSKVVGDVTDAELLDYNRLKPYIDGDAGVAYSDSSLFISATVPNLGATILKTSDSRFNTDQLLFVGVATYRLNLERYSSEFTMEPLAAYRIVKGYKDILDMGTNFSLNKEYYRLSCQMIYHTDKNMNAGFGVELKEAAVNFNYNFETGGISGYTNGAFEIGIKLHFLTKNSREDR